MPGHVIYTMATGREFSSSNGECQDSAVKEVLAAIFESAKSSSTPKKVVKKVCHTISAIFHKHHVLLHHIADHETQVL